jgi:hypothetical protein
MVFCHRGFAKLLLIKNACAPLPFVSRFSNRARDTVCSMSIELTLAPSGPLRDVVQPLLPAHADVALDHLARDAVGITLAVG